MRVAACIVTRGNVDLAEVIAPIPLSWELIVWDNSKMADMSVYGRYAAIELTDAEMIYVQDDDVVLDFDGFHTLRNAFQPDAITANMPPQFRHDFYERHCLVGFGAIFHRDLPKRAFDRFNAYYGDSVAEEWFMRTCDVVFTALSTRHLVDIGCENMPYASDPDRMWKQPEHQGERKHMLEYALRVAEA